MNPMNALSMPLPVSNPSNSIYQAYHTFICTSSNRDFAIGVNLLAEERRVRVGNSLLQTRTTLGLREKVPDTNMSDQNIP